MSVSLASAPGGGTGGATGPGVAEGSGSRVTTLPEQIRCGARARLEGVRADACARIRQLRLLHEHARRLRAPLDGDEVLDGVLAEAMAQTGAAGALFVPPGAAHPAEATLAGAARPDLVGELLAGFQRGQGPLAEALTSAQPVRGVASTGAPVLLARAQYAGLDWGVLGLLGPLQKRVFTAAEARLLHTLGTHLAGVLQTVQLRREVEHGADLQRELELARKFQRALLPAGSPQIRDVDIIASCEAAAHVGGDYFDFFPLGESQLGLVIADVAGHGVGAALVMAGFRAMLHGECGPGFAPGAVLARLNRRLVGDLGDSGLFVSAVLARYEITTGEVCYANAGHPPPLLLGADRAVQSRMDTGGPLLGLFSDLAYEQGVARLDPGGVLLLYTDGLTETRGRDGARLQEEGLVRLVRETGAVRPAELHADILARVSRHRAGAPTHDDLTLVVAARR